MDSGDWSIVLYREESGRSPVREFLDNLDETTQESVLVAVEMLRVRKSRLVNRWCGIWRASSGSYDARAEPTSTG